MSSYPGIQGEFLGSSYIKSPGKATPSEIPAFASINKQDSTYDKELHFSIPVIQGDINDPEDIPNKNSKQNEPEKKTIKSRFLWVIKGFPVLIYSLLFICTGSVQVLSFKKLGLALGPYPYFILITISFSFVPILFLSLGYIRLQTGGFLPETTTLKFKVHFFVIGMLNALNGVFTIFAIPYTAGTLQALFGQAVIPLVMLMAILYLRIRFVIPQYLGAFVIFGGIFIELYPLIFGGSITGGTKPFWAFIFLIGQVPAAAASVYQEKAFQKARVNVIYMMAWSNLAQFLFMMVFFPMNFIPHFGQIKFNQSASHYIDATKCLFNQLHGHESTCSSALPWWVASVGTMLLSGIFQTLIVKHGSATLSVIVQTLVTPVSAFLFTFHFIMGSNTEHMTGFTWGSLVVLMAGVVIYRLPDIVNYPRIKAKIVRVLTCGRILLRVPSAAIEVVNDIEDDFKGTIKSEEKDMVGKWITHDFTNRGLGYGMGDIDSDGSGEEDLNTRPMQLAPRVGIVINEYSAAKNDRRSIFFEHTLDRNNSSSGTVSDKMQRYASI